MMVNDRPIEVGAYDRTNVSLPGCQQNLASQICKLFKREVLAIIHGGIVEFLSILDLEEVKQLQMLFVVEIILMERIMNTFYMNLAYYWRFGIMSSWNNHNSTIKWCFV